jgi:hypothetical protein
MYENTAFSMGVHAHMACVATRFGAGGAGGAEVAEYPQCQYVLRALRRFMRASARVNYAANGRAYEPAEYETSYQQGYRLARGISCRLFEEL